MGEPLGQCTRTSAGPSAISLTRRLMPYTWMGMFVIGLLEEHASEIYHTTPGPGRTAAAPRQRCEFAVDSSLRRPPRWARRTTTERNATKGGRLLTRRYVVALLLSALTVAACDREPAAKGPTGGVS